MNELFLTESGNKRLCLSIYNDVLRQIGLSFLIAVLLTMSSIIIDKLLHILSGFEKYTDLNSKYSSRILKGFVMKYANSGIIILIINLKIKLGSKTLGRYDDMTPTWYVTIGYSVVFTYILKIISLLIWTFLRVTLPWLKRCCDRGCSNDVKKTKKKTLADQIALYTGMQFDIDRCYTDVLMNIFICMTFGTFLPIVYVISLIYLILLYYRDKILREFIFMKYFKIILN